MTQTDQDATLYAGTAPYFTVTVYQADGETERDISSDTFYWAMYDERSRVVLEKDSNSGVAITDGENGVCTVTLEKGDTVDFDGDFKHYLRLIDPTGDPAVVLEGTLTWKKLPRKT